MVGADPGPYLPQVTVVIPAYNEERVIAAKVANTLRLDYPADLLEVLVVADGATDATASEALAAGASVAFEPVRRGKSDAVNRGVAAASGEVVVLTDANCSLACGALRAMLTLFADPAVGVVSGEKRVVGHGVHGEGESLYWRLESAVKRRESVIGATMGAPGELLAIRRSAFRPLPPGVINDDYQLVCQVLADGWLVRYAPEAAAYEAVSASAGDEWERRSRIAAGTWQTTLAHLPLASPSRGWVSVAFVSHRLLRSVVVPVLLPALWLGSILAARRSRTARAFALGQTACYGGAAVGAWRGGRVFAAPFQFTLTNAACLCGAWRLLRGRQPAAWVRVTRSEWYETSASG
jgi:cellulose synthase/poly-beta-1,6-N-acetylglucosamine synthase-like glycosyltransferase